MSVKFTVTPRTQLIDKNGYPTRDLFRLLEYLNSVASNLSLLVVQDAINNGVTDIAPSQNAVFDRFAQFTETTGLATLLIEDAINNGTLTKAPSENAVFDALALKLDTTTASATYLTTVSAAATYLTIATATATYLSIADAGATYLEIADAATTYLTIANAATTYLPLAGGTLTGPLVLPSYTVATQPDATLYEGGMIYVADEAGGPTVAFSNGTNWLRVLDLVAIS